MAAGCHNYKHTLSSSSHPVLLGYNNGQQSVLSILGWKLTHLLNYVCNYLNKLFFCVGVEFIIILLIGEKTRLFSSKLSSHSCIMLQGFNNVVATSTSAGNDPTNTCTDTSIYTHVTVISRQMCVFVHERVSLFQTHFCEGVDCDPQCVPSPQETQESPDVDQPQSSSACMM